MAERLAPRNTTAKHQPIAPTRITSGDLAIQRKTMGTMVRETNTVTPARMAMPAKEEKMARKSGDCRLG